MVLSLRVFRNFLLLLYISSFGLINIAWAFNDAKSCEKHIFIDDTVIIDVQSQLDCKWRIQTYENRILAFSVVNGDMEQLQDFLSILDGLSEHSLLLKDQQVSKISRMDLPQTIYTTQAEAELRLKKQPVSPFQLKIQKAVACPFNLGAESQCGRVVDETSCYCATFTKRDHPSQMTYCQENSMLLLSLESQEEERAVQTAWGTTTVFWTSGSDARQEKTWIWEATNQTLYPGYANWAATQPDNAHAGENCLVINLNTKGQWNDTACNVTIDAICEAHP